MQANGNSSETQSQAPPGVVELREDVPLKAGSTFGADSNKCCGGGPRFILGCFAVLTAAITLALLTQIYYGDYQVVPHGSVSSSSEYCSQAGGEALKEGGRAIDAAVAAAFCLAVIAPHRTSLDSSGSILYWEYRTSHTSPPVYAEWGGADNPDGNVTGRPPRLVAALASLHSRLGVLPWSRVLQPAVVLARDGFPVSEGLAVAAANSVVNVAPGTIRKAPLLADYLEALQKNTSSELSLSWGSDRLVRTHGPEDTTIGGVWRIFSGGPGAAIAGAALATALADPFPDADTAFQRVVTALQQSSLHGEWPATGVASGLAVIDRLDTYVALVTGLTKPFGSGPSSGNGWVYDEPKADLDLSPAIIIDEHVCGTRYVMGAESSSALTQAAAALLTNQTGAQAVELPRVAVFAGGVLGIEAERNPPVGLPVALPTPLVNSTKPYPAVNVVLQTGDAMQSHSDSRGGGIAYRF